MGNSNVNQGCRELVLALCGLTGAGKETLLRSIFPETNIAMEIPTIGFQVNSARLEIAVSNVMLGIISPRIGNPRMWPLFSSYYDNCNGLIFMVDAADYHGHVATPTRRLDGNGNSARDDFNRMLGNDEGMVAGTKGRGGVGDRTNGLPLLILVNKMDTVTPVSQEEGELLKQRISVDLGMLQIEDWTCEGMRAFLMGTHARIGAQSLVNRLGHIPGVLEKIYSHMELAPLQRTALAKRMANRPCLVQFCAAINGDGIAEGLHWMDESINGGQDRSRKTNAFSPYHQDVLSNQRENDPPLRFVAAPPPPPLVRFSFPPQLATTNLAARNGIAFGIREAPAYT